jgi:lipopolysaccharide/colanic/teichoic acid biosynthesis glycosyltransferase
MSSSSLSLSNAAAQAAQDGATPAVPTPLGYLTGKRVLDLLVATTLLVVLTPLLLAVALLIRLDSPGSPLFMQERVGSRRRAGRGSEWGTRPFRVIKFRTMRQGADATVHREHIRRYAKDELAAADGARAPFKLGGDARITRIGRFLRRTSIDELPQLINVVRGEMSLVGPRPVPPYEADLCTGEARLRFAALPGITGPWQVRGRCSVPWAEMIRLDCEYVRERSFSLDLRILALTIPAVISGKGAG